MGKLGSRTREPSDLIVQMIYPEDEVLAEGASDDDVSCPGGSGVV